MFKTEDYRHIAVEKQRVMPVAVNLLETRPTTASDQMKAFAEARGQVDEAGNIDLSGLHAQQEDLEYVVNQRVVASEHDEPVIKERDWRWPLSADPDRSLRNFGRSSTRGGHRIDKTSVIDLDVFDPDKKLLATLQFGSQDEFYDFVDSHGSEKERDAFEKSARKLGFHLPLYLRNREGNTPLPRGPIDLNSLRWGETQPKALAELDPRDRKAIGIPLHADQKPFDSVFQHRAQLELAGELPGGSWIGLTIMFGDQKVQVVEDSMRFSSEPPRMKSDRVFKLAQFGNDGKEVRTSDERVYRFDDLQELINGGGFTGIHWEIPRATTVTRPRTPAEIAAERAMAASERALLEDIVDRETAGLEEIAQQKLRAVGGKGTTRKVNPTRKIKLSRERRAAVWLLAGADTRTGSTEEVTDEVTEQVTEEALAKQRRDDMEKLLTREPAHNMPRIKAVEQMIKDHGLAEVIELALRLQDTFTTYTENLVLRPSEAAMSDFGWAVQALASQYNVSLKHGINPRVHNPFTDTPEARQLQQQIVDLHLGTVAAETGIKHKTRPDKRLERVGITGDAAANLDKGRKGEELKEVIRMVDVAYVDPLFEASVPAVVKKRVLEILHTVTEKHAKLDGSKKLELGWLLHHAVNTER
jgi:hypothetical protein